MISRKPAHLLLVDDDPGLLKLLGMRLTSEGYSVVTAESGQEGLRVLNREKVDLVISDLRMDEMDGMQLFTEIQKVQPGMPIIAYQADEYKKDPSTGNEKEVVNWWVAVAHYFGQSSPLLGFDLIYEPSDKLNHNHVSLNRVYDKTIRTVHAIDPQRMIFIAPRLRAAPEDLPDLKLPPQSQNTVLAQWHIFPWGPLKNNGKYPWTSGTAAEKAAIRARINTAIHWQQKTGHVSWVGGWSPGETIRNAPSASQMAFARFMACELKKAKIPYAINADTQFYDGEEGAWRPALEPLLTTMIVPECEKPGDKPGHHTLKPPAPDATRVTPAEASKQKSTVP